MKRFAIISAVLIFAALFAVKAQTTVTATPVAGTDDPAVVISSPSAWTTLRSDSVVVSIQADTSRLPGNSVDFKVVRRSGSRSSTLFTKRVAIDSLNVEAFLGRVPNVPIGGADFISIEWSATGAPDVSGKIEPIGVVRLRGDTLGGRWIPAQPPLTAVRLKDGPIDSAAVDGALAKAMETSAFTAGGIKFAAGWNNEGIAILFAPPTAAEIEFAFDLKCGKNAFLAWADRFLAYNDGLRGLHYGNRTVGNDGIKQEEQAWGDARTLNLISGDVRVITARWHELGIQPFDGRNVGFAVFTKGRGVRQPAFYPTAARRDVPGTWGDIRLEK